MTSQPARDSHFAKNVGGGLKSETEPAKKKTNLSGNLVQLTARSIDRVSLMNMRELCGLS